MNEGCSFIGLAPRTWLAFQMELQVAFLEFWLAVLSPLGHTVISSALDFQPLHLRALRAGGKEVPGSQGLPDLG